jgi:hypothetical protein
MDTVRNTISQFAGKGGRRSSRAGGGLASQASGFIGGLLSSGSSSGRSSSRSRARGRRRR